MQTIDDLMPIQKYITHSKNIHFIFEEKYFGVLLTFKKIT